MADNGFPIGYFYIISKMNGLVVDLRGDPEHAEVYNSFLSNLILSPSCLKHILGFTEISLKN